MKRSLFLFTAVAAMVTVSCTTTIQVRKTYAAEMSLPVDTPRYVFVNFFDYRIPEYIKNKYEIAYSVDVRGYSAGIGEIVLMDPGSRFLVLDTLREGFNVASMQLPEFADTVRSICASSGANMLIALDSINLWMDWDIGVEETDEGGSIIVKDFYLYANNYMTLYNADGSVIDRCAGEKSTYVKSKYTVFGLIGGPTIAKARETVRLLARDGAKDCIGKFYPFVEYVPATLYTGGPFNDINMKIKSGHPEEALEPLRELKNSPDPKIAEKAAHNLSVVNDILENQRRYENYLQKNRE